MEILEASAEDDENLEEFRGVIKTIIRCAILTILPMHMQSCSCFKAQKNYVLPSKVGY